MPLQVHWCLFFRKEIPKIDEKYKLFHQLKCPLYHSAKGTNLPFPPGAHLTPPLSICQQGTPHSQ